MCVCACARARNILKNVILDLEFHNFRPCLIVFIFRKEDALWQTQALDEVGHIMVARKGYKRGKAAVPAFPSVVCPPLSNFFHWIVPVKDFLSPSRAT